MMFFFFCTGDGSNFGKGNPETTQVTIPNDVSWLLWFLFFVSDKNGEEYARYNIF